MLRSPHYIIVIRRHTLIIDSEICRHEDIAVGFIAAHWSLNLSQLISYIISKVIKLYRRWHA
jgi:hypothetical protein